MFLDSIVTSQNLIYVQSVALDNSYLQCKLYLIKHGFFLKHVYFTVQANGDPS